MTVYVVIDRKKDIKGIFATSMLAKGYIYRYNRNNNPKMFEILEFELCGCSLFDN